MELSNDQIDYIQKDINYRGLVYDDLEEEFLDHICTLVEEKMESGLKFIEAYDLVIQGFGAEEGLQNVQSQTLNLVNNNTKVMLQNYFKIALRSLSKHKFYSIINVAGLAVGLACCMLIALFVYDDLSYDDHHEHKERIYRITRHGSFNGTPFKYAVCPAPLGPALMQEIPEVQSAVRFRGSGTYLVRRPEASESFNEDRLIFTDEYFFDVFTVPLVSGNPKTALRDPRSIAISQSIANKYFKNEEAVGQTLILDGEDKYHVTAVFEDMPKSGHIRFNFLMSMSSLAESKNNEWLSNNFFTYVLLREGTSINDFKDKLKTVTDKHVAPAIQAFVGTSLDEYRALGNFVDFKVMALDKIYLHSDFVFDIATMGDITYIYLFSAVAIFILLIACINFMNLSTARSSNRAKEVGVRKVLGSYRSHLIKQFLLETMLLCLVAFVFAIAITSMALPFFNNMANKEMALPFYNPMFYGVIFIAIVIIGLLAGIYPAFFLSAFKPIHVLKGKLSLGTGSSILRSGLVIFQFFISILLIIGTATVYEQLSFIQNKKLGFSKEQVLIVGDTYMLQDKVEPFKKELLQLSGIKSATVSGYIPVHGYNRSDMTFWRKDQQPADDNMVSMQRWRVDADYVSTLGMELVAGRDFNEEIASDSTAMILNESAFKAYGFTDIEANNGISTFIFVDSLGTVDKNKYITYHVIGVMRDFHFETMKEDITPLAIVLGNSTSVVAVKFKTSETAEVIADVQKTWDKFSPDVPFNYTFLDSDFGNMYKSESRLANIFTIFSILAIFIGCLGLFALAAFMAEQRTKEIGIRKVLGASVGGIVFMLSREFGKLIIISFVIAAPLAWWLTSKWLDNYSYRIDVNIWLYALAGLGAFIISWLTVGYQSVKAARSNPVDSLRSE